jgi:hypothetical protein
MLTTASHASHTTNWYRSSGLKMKEGEAHVPRAHLAQVDHKPTVALDFKSGALHKAAQNGNQASAVKVPGFAVVLLTWAQ